MTPVPLHRSQSFQAFSRHVDSAPTQISSHSKNDVHPNGCSSHAHTTSTLIDGRRVKRQNTMRLPTAPTADPSIFPSGSFSTEIATSASNPFPYNRRTKSLSGKSISGKSVRSMRSLGSLGSFSLRRQGLGRSASGRYRAFEGSVDDLSAFEDAKPRKKSTSKPPSSFPPTLARSASASASDPIHPRYQRHNKSVPNLRIALGKSGGGSGSISASSGPPSIASLSASSSSTSLQQGLDTPVSSGAVSIRTTRSTRSTRSTCTTHTAHTGFSALTTSSTIRAKVPGNPSHPFIDYVPGPLFAKAPRVCMGTLYANKALPSLPSSDDEYDEYEDFTFESGTDDTTLSSSSRRPSRRANDRGKLMPPVPRVPTMYASPATLARRATERERANNINLERKMSKSAISTGTKRRSRLQVRFRSSNSHRASQASMIAQEWKKRQSALIPTGPPSPSPWRAEVVEEGKESEGLEVDGQEGRQGQGLEMLGTPQSAMRSTTAATAVDAAPEVSVQAGLRTDQRPPSLPPKPLGAASPSNTHTASKAGRAPRAAPPALVLSHPSPLSHSSVTSTGRTKHSSRPAQIPQPTLRSSSTDCSSSADTEPSPYKIEIAIPSSRISRVSRYMGDWEWYSNQLAMEAAAAVSSMPDLSAGEVKRAADVLLRGSRMGLPVGTGSEGRRNGRGRLQSKPAVLDPIMEQQNHVVKPMALESTNYTPPRPAQLALTSSNHQTTFFATPTVHSRSGTMTSMSSVGSLTSDTSSATSIATVNTASTADSTVSVTSDILSSYDASPTTASTSSNGLESKGSGSYLSYGTRSAATTPTPMTAAKSPAHIQPAARLPSIAHRHGAAAMTASHHTRDAVVKGMNIGKAIPLVHDNLARAGLAREKTHVAEGSDRRDSGNSELSDLVDLVHLASLASAEDLAPFMRHSGAFGISPPQKSQTMNPEHASFAASTTMHRREQSPTVSTEHITTVRIPERARTTTALSPVHHDHVRTHFSTITSATSARPKDDSEKSSPSAGEKRSRGRLNRSSSIVGGTVVSPVRRQLRMQAHAPIQGVVVGE